jgi:hypothetical protein
VLCMDCMQTKPLELPYLKVNKLITTDDSTCTRHLCISETFGSGRCTATPHHYFSSMYLCTDYLDSAMKTMRDLLHKYPLGYEGYRVEKGLPLAHDGEKAEVLEPQGSPSGCSPMVQVYGFHDRASPLVPASGPAVSTQR